MFVDDRFYVRHTAIAYLNVSVKVCAACDVMENVCQLVSEMLYLCLSDLLHYSFPTGCIVYYWCLISKILAYGYDRIY